MSKLKTYLEFYPTILFAILPVFVLSSCLSNDVSPPSTENIELPEPMAKKILDPAEQGKGLTDKLDDEVDTISQSASSGETKAPDLSEWETIRKSAGNVKNYGREARELFNIIAEMARRLEKNEEEIAKAGVQIDKKDKEIARLREKNRKMEESATRTILLAGIFFSVAGLGIGISLFFIPGLKRAAIPVIAISLVVGAVSRVLVNHPWILTIVGFSFIGIFIWAIFTQTKVIKELVNFGEWAKWRPEWGNKERLDAEKSQSETTKKVVKAVKKKIKKDGSSKPKKDPEHVM